MTFNRRQFLTLATKGSGILAASVWLPGFMVKGKSMPVNESPIHSLYVSIHPDNRIVFNLSKQEMGQGISTGYAMIFADELGADLDRMEIVDADYSKTFSLAMQGITGGSSSTSIAWQPLREAAAELRARLVAAAGRYWKEAPRGYTSRGSRVVDQMKNRSVAFGELIPFVLPDEKVEAQLKPASEFQYIGKSIPNVRFGGIVSGKQQYGLDVSLPGMLYASIERCPVFLGKALNIDDRAARKVPGVVDVFHLEGFRRDAASEDMSPSYLYTVPDGVAVIATNSWAACREGRH
ncbi:MAG: molybdopterin-dependent oxidoreductase [Chryseolinea sp.]